MKKPEIIRKLEERDEIFSIAKINGQISNFDKFIENRSLDLIYSEGSINYDLINITHDTKIYKSKQDFYLHLFIDDKGETCVNIYYKIKQLNELKLFITQLLKEYKKQQIN